MNNKTGIMIMLFIMAAALLLFRKDYSYYGDLGRQIKMGEVISRCRCIPQVNLFSYTHPQHEAVNYSWLSQLIFYQLSDRFGTDSLLVMKMFFISVSFGIVFRLTLRKKTLYIPAGVFGMLSLLLFSQRFWVRPELFSYVFVALFLLVLHISHSSRTYRALWFLPVLMVLWVNTHIYFPLGIILYLIFVMQEFVRKGIIVCKQLVPVTLVLFAAVLINPLGLRGAVYPFMVFNNYAAAVAENYSPLVYLISGQSLFSVFGSYLLVYCILSLLVLIFLTFTPRKSMIAVKSNAVIGLLLGAGLVRSVGFFSLLTLPFLVERYAEMRKSLTVYFGVRVRYLTDAGLFTFLVLVIAIQTLHFLRTEDLGAGFVLPAEKGTEFFLSNRISGPVFNNFSMGNYLIYRLYPGEKVFIDGRPEAYPEALLAEHQESLRDYGRFMQLVRKYDINTVFFGFKDDPELTRAFIKRIMAEPEWVPVYFDGEVIILVKQSKQNEMIIKSHGLNPGIVLKQLQATR
jgi:hypothetical protein